VLVVLLGLLGGGLYFTYQYTQSRYYIGATESGQIAIFRGVPGQVAGFSLSEVREVSQVHLEELTAIAQDQVRKGILADNEADAHKRLNELISNDPSNVNLLPRCPAPSASPTPAPDGSPIATDSPAEPSASAQPNEPVVASPVPCRSK
jgi:protein phosphatase